MNRSLASLGFLLLLLGACVRTDPRLPETTFERPSEAVSVLLMPTDIALYEVTAAGLLEPNAEWTETARQNIAAALGDDLAGRDAAVVAYTPPEDALLRHQPRHQQLVKLHDAVGSAILFHGQLPILGLPTKPTLDYTLGPGIAVLRSDYEADYALFLTLRDSFSSAGRVALMVIGAALGAVVPGGQQFGYISLVDLDDDRIVWFNTVNSSIGDPREKQGAHETTQRLLDGLPL
jgi:hypothetical protein